MGGIIIKQLKYGDLIKKQKLSSNLINKFIVEGKTIGIKNLFCAKENSSVNYNLSFDLEAVVETFL